MSEQKTHVVELTEPQAEKIRAAFADVDRANRHASTLVAFALDGNAPAPSMWTMPRLDGTVLSVDVST